MLLEILSLFFFKFVEHRGSFIDAASPASRNPCNRIWRIYARERRAKPSTRSRSAIARVFLPRASPRRHPSSSLLRLTVPAIVIKSARRTGRGSLRLPSTPHCSLYSSPSIALAVHRPRCTRPAVSLLRVTLSAQPPSRCAPPLSVCHEMHIKTYLVRFARGWEGRR